MNMSAFLQMQAQTDLGFPQWSNSTTYIIPLAIPPEIGAGFAFLSLSPTAIVLKIQLVNTCISCLVYVGHVIISCGLLFSFLATLYISFLFHL